MDESVIEAIGGISLRMLFVCVGACLVGMIVRILAVRAPGVVRRGPSDGETGRLTRWLFEYIGNASLEELRVEARAEDRRRNRQARRLLDVVQSEIAKREISRSESERILERLRETIRGEGQGPVG